MSRPMGHTGKRGRALAVAACVAAGSLAVLAQEAARPAAAQAALERGVAAGNRKDFKTAITEFLDAESLAPRDPDVLLNLGSAYAGDSQSLPAIGWLRTYLEAAPAAPNAARVALEITRLKTELRGNEDRVFNQALRAASQIDTSTPRGAADYQNAMGAVASSQVAAGRYDEARTTLGQMRAPGQMKADLEDRIAMDRAHLAALEGDFAAAASWLAKLGDAPFAVAGTRVILPSMSGPPSERREYDLLDDPVPTFWRRIARELTQRPDDCWTIDEALARQALQQAGGDPSGYERLLPRYPGFMGTLGLSGSSTSWDKVHACAAESTVDLWKGFTETICNNGRACQVAATVENAARDAADLETITSRLARLASDVAEKLAAFDVLDARSAHRHAR